jgi:TetR/AcrR family transcriptional repressor of nem operon
MATTEPPTKKGRATRDRIVDAATTLVFERGVAGTALDDVRAAAKVSKSQLYHYFADKDDLVHAVSSWAAIRAWLDDLVALQVDRRAVGGCPIGGLAGQLAETDAVAREELAEGFERWEAPLRRGLQAMKAAGKLSRSADPDRLATATMASIQGGLVLTQTRRDPAQMRIAVDAAYSYLRSFAARSASPEKAALHVGGT